MQDLAFTDVDVGVGEGAFEEGGPEVVDGVAGGHGEHAFALEATGGGRHLEVEGEADFADGVEAAGDVGVFAVEADGGVEASDGFEGGAIDDEVSSLHHGADAEEVAVGGVAGPGRHIEDVDEDALAGREVVIDERAGEGGEDAGVGIGGGLGFGFGEGGEDVGDPVGGEAGVGVDVGDERSGAGGEACLAGEGEALARLVDDDHAGIAESDFAGAVGAGVVDDDDLAGSGKARGGEVDLAEDGFEAGGQIGLLVICGNDEA